MSDDNIPIIDAHHHFWDLSLDGQPWLCREPMIPFRYGDYSTIRRNFLLADYAKATAGHNIVATVTMEAEWDEARLVEETEWTQALHRVNSAFPAAHIARTILHAADADAQLARQARYGFVRGIRHKPTAAPDARSIEHGTAGGMTDPAWRRGYAALRSHDLHFELQAPWWHVDELLDLVAAFPDTPVVINHAFLPADRSLAAMAGWRAAIKKAATAPQVAIKISGVGRKGLNWSLDDNQPIVRDLVAAFGARRCMFASNFPVDGLTGSFDTIYAGFKAATADLTRAERIDLFHDNAIRIYRLRAPLAADT